MAGAAEQGSEVEPLADVDNERDPRPAQRAAVVAEDIAVVASAEKDGAGDVPRLLFAAAGGTSEAGAEAAGEGGAT